MSRAVLSLGSNLDDRFGHLRGAVEGLADVLRVVSPVYENPAWGLTDQPDFLNAVVLVEADGVDAWSWLRKARALEQAAGRRRAIRWGPRTLDVDVVTVDGVTSTDPELTLPHPGAHERVSVLLPWHDIDTAAVLPGHGRVEDLLARLDQSVMHRRDDLDLRPGREGPASRPTAAGGGSRRRPLDAERPDSGAADGGRRGLRPPDGGRPTPRPSRMDDPTTGAARAERPAPRPGDGTVSATRPAPGAGR